MIRLVLVLLNIVCMVTAKLVLEDGYYWRDYKHKIPSDAIPCGLDNTGSPIYAGQVLYDDKLVPGKIYSNNSDIYFHWGPVEQRDNKNIKILCSPFQAKFEWIWTNPKDVTKLTQKVLVDGGYEPTYFTYIGRFYAGDETTVGKVICQTDSCLALFYDLNGRGLKHEGPFEILAYKYDKE